MRKTGEIPFVLTCYAILATLLVMKYPLMMFSVSAMLILYAFKHPQYVVIFVWAAISFAIVAFGYAGMGVKVFSKSKGGVIPVWAKVLNLPFLLYTWSVWHLYRSLSREDAYNIVNEDLVVGRRLLSGELDEKFDCYIDLTAEFDEPSEIRSAKGYLCVPILDANVPTIEQLEKIVEVAKEGRVYVHCAQGHGRTALVALVLLLARGEIKSVSEGISLLSQVRPAMGLNRVQQKFINRYSGGKW